jgi:hypothetical protein
MQTKHEILFIAVPLLSLVGYDVPQHECAEDIYVVIVEGLHDDQAESRCLQRTQKVGQSVFDPGLGQRVN